MWLGHHLRLADVEGDEPGVLVVHSRGFSTGPRHGRVYVPASYHVFKVLGSDDSGLLSLTHLTSFPVRMSERGGANTGAPLYWRPYPDPARMIGNGQRAHLEPGPLTDGGTNLN